MMADVRSCGPFSLLRGITLPLYILTWSAHNGKAAACRPAPEKFVAECKKAPLANERAFFECTRLAGPRSAFTGTVTPLRLGLLRNRPLNDPLLRPWSGTASCDVLIHQRCCVTQNVTPQAAFGRESRLTQFPRAEFRGWSLIERLKIGRIYRNRSVGLSYCQSAPPPNASKRLHVERPL